ncbi:MAG TPA: hypothetical protein VMV10_19855 [Pirellulales bacterium]|nr:hypothetical protein [Pirellulales bacterium]
MAIAVTCPSCKAKFSVSDKFAGKQGPCPKCKATITIPKPAEPGAATAEVPAAKPGASPGKAGAAAAASQPAPAPEIVVHEPESSGPKGASGRSVTKPILRRETRFQWVPALMISGAVLVTLAVSWILRAQLKELLWLRGVGLLLVSPAIAVAGYSFLRDDELEPYRGRSLWLRASLCGLVYMALWGVFWFVPGEATAEAWGWILVGPPFFLVGAGAAFATLDLDFGNAFFHYCFYVLATLLLGAAAGLAMPWAAVAS